ncbi:short-chain dehydrogenase [Candidatus Entotheonella serta]|nr:short-chain dehydrogenase [Candidatus Entotheonella serta]
MAGRLDGKVIIIAGAASRGEGVGTWKAIAMLAAREGAKVTLVNRTAERAEALRREILEEGGDAMVAATEDHYGKVTGLVNNIGSGISGTIVELSEEDWDRVMQINLKTAMQGTKAAVPAMLRAGGGSIVNISSSVGWAGLMSDRGAAAYATAKSALHGLTHSTAANFANQGIRCNCIIVGTISTPMVAHLGEEALRRRVDMVPLQTEGTGWDVGHAAIFLLSEESRWVTAINLPVDGSLDGLRIWPR